jgi:small-conductance mechanosensitive channel
MNFQTRHPLLLGARLLAVAWILAAVVAVPLNAQETGAGETTPPAAEKPAGPQPIPASQISLKAQETEAALKEMSDRPAPQPSITKIGEDITVTLGELHALQGLTDKMLEESFSVREFEDSERRWAREVERINTWKSQVQKRAQDLDRDLETLQRGRAIWEVTLVSATEAGSQDALIEVIRAELASIAALEEQFGGRRAELLTIQEQIAEATSIVDEALAAIKKAKNDTSRFLASESPPLWKLLSNLPPTANHAAEIRKVWAQGIEDLRFSISGYEAQLINHLVLFVVVLIIMYVLRGKVRSSDDGTTELEIAKHTLGRPVAASLLVSLLLVQFHFKDAPRIIDDIVLVVALIPLWRLIPSRAVAKMRPALTALFVLTILVRFIDMLAYLSPLQRVTSLAVDIAAAGFVVWVLRTQSMGGTAIAPISSSLLRGFTRIFLLLLVAAIVTSVIGYFSIATIITNGVLFSAYIAVVLYVIRLVVSSVIWVGLGTEAAHRLKTIDRHEALIRSRTLYILRSVVAIVWIRASLTRLQVWRLVSGGLWGALNAKARFGEVSVSLFGFVSLIVTIWAAVLLSRFVRFVLEDDVFPRLWLPRGVPNAISTSIHYVILTAGFFLAIAATGVDLNKFAILAGAFGVGLGFGMQNVVANFVAGLILIFERPIMQGDTVQIGTVGGVVKSIGMRSTIVRTWEGAEVIVPNGKLIAEEVTNWTLSDRRRRIDVEVGVAYGTDTSKVLELLTTAASWR